MSGHFCKRGVYFLKDTFLKRYTLKPLQILTLQATAHIFADFVFIIAI